MSQAESESADADADADAENDEFTYYPQVTQHPTTVIEGDIVDLVTGADIDDGVEQTGASFGVVYEDAEVVGDGTVWRNRNIPDGFETTSEYNDTIRMAQAGDNTNYVRGREVTDEAIEAAQDRLDEAGVDYDDSDYDEIKVSGTDYKVSDPSDTESEVDEVTFDGETKVTGIDVGGGTFKSEQVDGFESDRIMVWYGGMSGQFVGRGLDFNGMPFARYTEDGYLIKGLFQVAIGWRGDADVEAYDNVPSTNRKELATDLGRKPRVARPPVLRDDIDGRAFIGIGRYNGGQMHEVHIGRAKSDYSEILADMRANDQPDYDGLDMVYNQDAEEVLSAEFDDASNIYALYHGEGWQSKPDNAQNVMDEGGDTDDGSFDVEMDDEGVDHPTAKETTFAKTVAEKLAGTGATPDEAFESKGGLDGLVEANADNFGDDYDTEAIRAEVYKHTEHLDESDA